MNAYNGMHAWLPRTNPRDSFFCFFLFFMRTFNESTRWQINITHKHWQSSIRMPRLLNFSFRLIHDGGSACPSTALSIQHCNKWIIFHTVNESENEMTAIYCLKLIWNAGWKLYEWHLWSVVSAECRLAIERGIKQFEKWNKTSASNARSNNKHDLLCFSLGRWLCRTAIIGQWATNWSWNNQFQS